jgi:hypothetical protein
MAAADRSEKRSGHELRLAATMSPLTGG